MGSIVGDWMMRRVVHIAVLTAFVVVVALIVVNLASTSPLYKVGVPLAAAGTTLTMNETVQGQWGTYLNFTVPVVPSAYGNHPVGQTRLSLSGVVYTNGSVTLRLTGNGGFWWTPSPLSGTFDAGKVIGAGQYYAPIDSGNYSLVFLSETRGTSLLVLTDIEVE